MSTNTTVDKVAELSAESDLANANFNASATLDQISELGSQLDVVNASFIRASAELLINAIRSGDAGAVQQLVGIYSARKSEAPPAINLLLDIRNLLSAAKSGSSS